jgi:ABC-2 type transport system ATP-binding protein
MSLAIDASELRKVYPPDVIALDGVDMAVAKGTIFALLGPNGAGKSTTVRVLTTLSRPDGGNARVAGIDVLADPDRVRRSIGVVGQKHGVDPEATGRENLRLQGDLYGIGARDLRSRIGELLGRFDLADDADRLVRGWSGGMQRKLDVAMGLINRPRVLFLDEPTTGLDPEARAEMWGEISRLASDEQMTILLTTHYMEEADKLASRVAIIDRGKIVVEGTPEQLKNELEGDTIEVDLAQPDDGSARVALERVDDLEEITVDGQIMRASARDGSSAVPAVLAALNGSGVEAASVTLARPTLDDVYLRYAGRAFHQAEIERAEVAA